MEEPEQETREATPGEVDTMESGGSGWFGAVDTRLLLVATLAAGVAIGALWVGGFSLFDESPPDPEIESVAVIESGCHDDVRSRAMSSSDGAYVSTINDTSKHTEVSAQIRRTSRPDATVATYRLHLRTHNATAEAGECPGKIVYRVEFDAPYPDAADAMRTERWVNGEFSTCSSSSSGPETWCRELHEERPTHYSNGTIRNASP
ncbi:MAG: hypothetical protein PPP55_12035 [Halorubrum sp.]